MPSLKQFKNKEEYNLWFKEYRKRFPDKWRNYRKEWRKKNGHDYKEYKKKYPEKYNAHKLVTYAVRSGILDRKPCEVCGDTKSKGHHEDYSKPLEVKWLCQSHHSEVHKELVHLHNVQGERTMKKTP